MTVSPASLPSAPPLRRCRVLLPFAEPEQRHAMMDYQNGEVPDDLAQWFAGLDLEWDWVGVTPGTLAGTIAALRADAPPGELVAINLCDGDDINGYPGLSVVKALEAACLPYTGADPAFYALSTSKLAMKQRFAAAGVPTAPWRVLRTPAEDLPRAAREIGLPLFIKPDVSAAAAGIASRSRVDDVQAGLDWVETLRGGMHGFRFDANTIFAERFAPGREFSVLVAADADAPGGAVAFTPCERLFHPALTPDQRFVTFARNYGGDPSETPYPDGVDSYRYIPAGPGLQDGLRQVAIDAFRALDATGYGRVDIRQDAQGGLVVLEVNANCSLSADPGATTAGAILSFSGSTMAALLVLMLRDARRRWAQRENKERPQ